jgi:NADP-reducing hydrogenase subunit HndB
MAKIKVEDLEKIREKVRETMVLREGGPYKAKVIMHMGTCGIASGARKIMSALLKEIEAKNIKDVIVTTSGCAGLCSREPMVTVELLGKAPVKYVDLTEEKIRKIFNEHILGGNIVSEYALAIGSERTS